MELSTREKGEKGGGPRKDRVSRELARNKGGKRIPKRRKRDARGRSVLSHEKWEGRRRGRRSVGTIFPRNVMCREGRERHSLHVSLVVLETWKEEGGAYCCAICSLGGGGGERERGTVVTIALPLEEERGRLAFTLQMAGGKNKSPSISRGGPQSFYIIKGDRGALRGIQSSLTIEEWIGILIQPNWTSKG